MLVLDNGVVCLMNYERLGVLRGR